MFKYFAVLAILSVASTLAQEPIRDNVGDFANYVFEGILNLYYQQNGLIDLPDHGIASEGTFRNLTHIQRLEDIWIHADSASYNPRPVTFQFKLDQAFVLYENYRASLLAKRQLQYNLNDLEFSAKIAIEVGQTQCRVLFDAVEVTKKGEIANEKVTGGLLPGVNDFLKFASGSKPSVVRAVQKDIEDKIRQVLGNGNFDCGSYGPSRLFAPLI